MTYRHYFAREPSAESVIDEWAVMRANSDDPDYPICVEVGGTGMDVSVREAKAMRVGLTRAIKDAEQRRVS